MIEKLDENNYRVLKAIDIQDVHGKTVSVYKVIDTVSYEELEIRITNAQAALDFVQGIKDEIDTTNEQGLEISTPLKAIN